MKEKLKIIGIIALAAVMGLAMTACGDLLSDDPCTNGDHNWGNWVGIAYGSYKECKETGCNGTEYCFCEDDPSEGYTNWVPTGTTANRQCLNCNKNYGLREKHFYGKWTATLTNSTHTVELRESLFKISSSIVSGDSFTLSSALWTAEANGSSHAASKASYPVGYAITGTSATTGTIFSGNTNAGVYMKPDGSAIVIRLTGVHMPANGQAAREYTFYQE